MKNARDQRIREIWDRPGALRWLGFAGSLIIAADTWWYGAYPHMRPIATIPWLLSRPSGVMIALLWIAGTAALCTAWWHGRPLATRGAITSRWVTGTAVLWALPMLFIPPTGSRDVYAYVCQGQLFAHGYSPYDNGISALPCPWLDSVSVVWRDTPAPYGPIFLWFARLTAHLGSQAAAIVAFRLLAVAGLALAAVCLPIVARRVGIPASRSLWLVLACPIVIVHLVGGAHNDALVIGLIVAALAVLAPIRDTNALPVPRSNAAVPSTSAKPRPYGALIAGGALFGAAIAVKTTVCVALPFIGLFAVCGPALPGWPVVIRKAGTVCVSALGTLLVLSYASGLGIGWIKALSAAGNSVSVTSPPSAVGLAINYTASVFGLHIDAVPAARLIALVLMPIALVTILWHARDHNPLYAGALALLTIVFLAPITQPWYLTWALVLFAATNVSARWFAGTVVASMFLILPDGNGVNRFLQVPGSFVVTGLVIWIGFRTVSWLRGYEPVEIDFSAPATVPPIPATSV